MGREMVEFMRILTKGRIHIDLEENVRGDNKGGGGETYVEAKGRWEALEKDRWEPRGWARH